MIFCITVSNVDATVIDHFRTTNFTANWILLWLRSSLSSVLSVFLSVFEHDNSETTDICILRPRSRSSHYIFPIYYKPKFQVYNLG